MGVPSCPLHKSPMKMGRDNKTYFCPRKDANTGEWCKEKASVEPPAESAAPQGAARHATPASASPKLLLLLGSMEFAARIYQGTGQGDDAIALANEILRLNSMEEGV